MKSSKIVSLIFVSLTGVALAQNLLFFSFFNRYAHQIFGSLIDHISIVILYNSGGFVHHRVKLLIQGREPLICFVKSDHYENIFEVDPAEFVEFVRLSSSFQHGTIIGEPLVNSDRYDITIFRWDVKKINKIVVYTPPGAPVESLDNASRIQKILRKWIDCALRE